MQEDQQNYYHPPEPNDPNQFGEWGLYEYRDGFGVRFGAFLIDTFIYFIIFLLISFPVGIIDYYMGLDWKVLTDPNFMNDQEFQQIMLWSGLISNGLLIIYMMMDAFLAGTVGKLILNRRIANADRTKADVNTLSKRALIKWGFIFLNLLGLVNALQFFNSIGGLYWLIIFFGALAMLSQKKQALHDLIANTAVYHVDDILKDKQVQ